MVARPEGKQAAHHTCTERATLRAQAGIYSECRPTGSDSGKSFSFQVPVEREDVGTGTTTFVFFLLGIPQSRCYLGCRKRPKQGSVVGLGRMEKVGRYDCK